MIWHPEKNIFPFWPVFHSSAEVSPIVDIPNHSLPFFYLGYFSLSLETNMISSKEKYNLKTLKKAVKAVKEDGMLYGAAAKLFQIPKPTLYKKCLQTVVQM